MPLSEQLRRGRALVRRRRLDDELREEVDAHIELRRQQLIESGVPAAEALMSARRQFGNVTLVRENSRIMWSFPAVESILQDLGLWISDSHAPHPPHRHGRVLRIGRAARQPGAAWKAGRRRRPA